MRSTFPPPFLRSFSALFCWQNAIISAFSPRLFERLYSHFFPRKSPKVLRDVFFLPGLVFSLFKRQKTGYFSFWQRQIVSLLKLLLKIISNYLNQYPNIDFFFRQVNSYCFKNSKKKGWPFFSVEKILDLCLYLTMLHVCLV